MNLKLAAEDLLTQVEEVISQLTDQDFCKPIAILSDSSMGQHVRHTLEFFICLVDAQNNGVINYDQRKHDKFIETDRHLALSVINTMKEFLAKMDSNMPLKLEMSYGAEKELDVVSVDTNLMREVAYNIEHTVHHMALLKIGIVTNFNYVKLPLHFGVASSTVRYKASN